MLKKAVVLCVVFLVGLCLSHVYANKISKMDMSFDFQAKTLKVSISHEVQDPEVDYIKRVRVFVNDINLIEQSIRAQMDKEGETLVYVLPDVKKGDTISVRVYCSQNEEAAKTLTVKGE